MDEGRKGERWTGKEAERAHRCLSRRSLDTSVVFFFSSVRRRLLQFGLRLRLTSCGASSRDVRGHAHVISSTLRRTLHRWRYRERRKLKGEAPPFSSHPLESTMSRAWFSHSEMEMCTKFRGGRRMARRRQSCCMASRFPPSFPKSRVCLDRQRWGAGNAT